MNWKDYNDNYEVSDTGLVKSKQRYVVNNNRGGRRLVKERILSQKTKTNGYKEVAVYANQKGTMRYVHRMVYEAFVGPIQEGKEINHLDGDKANNNLSNLECVTVSQNAKHRHHFLKKRAPSFKGSSHPRSKLTEQKVKRIRASYCGGMTPTEISEHYGIPYSTVCNIVHRNTWTHI